MAKVPTVEQALADPSIRNLTKDTLRKALDKDALDAWRDVQLAADILRARFDALVVVDGPCVLDPSHPTHVGPCGAYRSPANVRADKTAADAARARAGHPAWRGR